MKPVISNSGKSAWPRRYQTALYRFLRQETPACLAAADTLGSQAVALGLDTLHIAGIHERLLKDVPRPHDVPGGSRQATIALAEAFFKATIVPIESTHQAARQADARIATLDRSLRQRTGALAETAVRLQQETSRCNVTENLLEKSKSKHDQLREAAQRMQKRLRKRIRCILSQQEGERNQIGQVLRDELAQALVGIDFSLLALDKADQTHAGSLAKSIAHAQQLLQESDDGIDSSSKPKDAL